MPALLEPPTQRGSALEYGPGEPQPLRWTNDDVRRMSDRGEFRGKKILLIDGFILDMAIPGPLHDMCVQLLKQLLMIAFGAAFTVREEKGLQTALDTNPVPDIAVVIGGIRDYQIHPTPADCKLVVEVADTSRHFDLGTKSHLYASAGIREYWVLDIENRKLHVHRDPFADEASPRGHRYGTLLVLGDVESIAPLAAADKLLAIADMLP